MQSGNRKISTGCPIHLSLPSRTLGGSWFVNRLGSGWLEDELCPNETFGNQSVVETGQVREQRKLSAADMALLLRLRFALQEYESCPAPSGTVQRATISGAGET